MTLRYNLVPTYITLVNAKPAKLTMLIGLLLSATACTSTGDLGRVQGFDAQSGYTNAHLGSATDGSSGSLAEPLVISDTERDLQRRLQRFQNLKAGSGWLADVTYQVRLATGRQLTEADYFNWLKSEYETSLEAAYGRIVNDVQIDLLTLNELFQAACKVQQTDLQRKIASNAINTTPDATVAALDARIADNAEIIRRIHTVLEFRYNSYSYALEQMLVQAPSESARNVDIKLNALATKVEQSNSGDYCRIVGQLDARPASRFSSPATTIDL